MDAAGDGENAGASTVARPDPREHERAAVAHDVCGRLLLVEMLFWKDQRSAHAIGQQYNWQVSHMSTNLIGLTVMSGCIHVSVVFVGISVYTLPFWENLEFRHANHV
jgi:hypothetical protein